MRLKERNENQKNHQETPWPYRSAEKRKEIKMTPVSVALYVQHEFVMEPRAVLFWACIVLLSRRPEELLLLPKKLLLGQATLLHLALLLLP